MGAPIDLSYVMPVVVNTELGSGLGEARGREATSSPSDVADAIVEALQLARFDVWVPKSVASDHERRSARAAARAAARRMARALKADRVLPTPTSRAPRPTSCAPRTPSRGSSRARPGADPRSSARARPGD